MIAAPLTLYAAGPATPAVSTVNARKLQLPFDRSGSLKGSFEAEYYVEGRFDRGKPTVFLVADGQQFFLRPELMPSYRQTYGSDVNLVGVPGRGMSGEVQRSTGVSPNTDWHVAYELLRYENWSNDIDAIRRDLLGESGAIYVHGRSGGGELVHEHLSRYPRSVRFALTQAAVMANLDAEFGLDTDHFWDEITESERRSLSGILASKSYDRALVAALFQRQNFFVPPDKIAEARSQLVAELARHDETAIAGRVKAYQVDAIEKLLHSPLEPAIRVRLYEFCAPLAERFDRPSLRFRPDLEVSFNIARPLLELRAAGTLPFPAVDFKALHRSDCEVTLVAGRWDHTADWRIQMALASHYPAHALVLLDDSHDFLNLAKQPGGIGPLLRASWHGHESAEFKAALAELEPLIWHEA